MIPRLLFSASAAACCDKVEKKIVEGISGCSKRRAENWTDTEVSAWVELRFILFQCQTSKIRECDATLYLFSCKCESNSKPDLLLHNRNLFSVREKVVDFLKKQILIVLLKIYF